MASRLSVIIVTWNSADVLQACLRPLVQELEPGDELIVADNASPDRSLEVAASIAPGALLVQNGTNLGFAAGANRGAEAASGDVLVFLNPDTVIKPGWARAIRRPHAEAYGWDAWQGLVTMDNGRRVNTDGGVIHFTGISWAGNAGKPVDRGDMSPREVAFASGACLAVRRDVWQRLGGMPESFFMYCEDVDLSLRVWLAGGRVGIEPTAEVNHDYEFAGRGTRWRMLERNRWATILRTYPAPLLALVLPGLVATEIALLAVAWTSGWGGQKLAALGDVARSLPRLLGERRAVQATRRATAGEIARHMTAELSSDYVSAVARNPVLRFVLTGYWRVVRSLLGG